MDCYEKYDGICQYCGELLQKDNYKIRDSWVGKYPIHDYCEHMIKLENEYLEKTK